jgi:anti-anti-sigma factor
MRKQTASYDIAGIRYLLLAAFTPDSLRRFCVDRPVFRPLLLDFGGDPSLSRMVDQVIDFCRTQLLWDELLAAVQEENPRQYARFATQLGLSQPPAPSTPPDVEPSLSLGYLTKKNPAFEVTVPLFDRRHVEEQLAERLQTSLIEEFGWRPKRAAVAYFVFTELVANAFDHGCQGHGERLVLVAAEVEGKTRLVIRVTSPGEGYNLAQELEKAGTPDDEDFRGGGLWFVNRMADELTTGSNGSITQAIISEEPRKSRYQQEFVITRHRRTKRGRVIAIKLPGRLDTSVAQFFEEQALRLLDEGPRVLILDCEELFFICSRGMWVIIDLQKRVQRTPGMSLALTNVSSQILEVFSYLGLAESLPICHTIEELIQIVAR